MSDENNSSGQAPGALPLADLAEGGQTRAATGDLALIADIPVEVTVELGRRRITIRDLLQLAPGSVVELDRATGEPLNVYANGCLIAHGEVVVVNNSYGIRLTDVVTPADRLRRLDK